jgi:hypothetical protein
MDSYGDVVRSEVPGLNFGPARRKQNIARRKETAFQLPEG